MRKPAAAAISVAWGVVIGGTFGCLLPYLLGDWHFHRPLPYWAIAHVAGGLLIGAGLVPVVQSFAGFIKAGGTPVPVASPPRLVVSGFYRHVRNPIYVGFLAIMVGQALLFGSPGLLNTPRSPGAWARRVCASMRNPPWPAGSGPNTPITGAPCVPGYPGCTHGRPVSQIERLDRMRSAGLAGHDQAGSR